jgi:hypothetical protein
MQSFDPALIEVAAMGTKRTLQPSLRLKPCPGLLNVLKAGDPRGSRPLSSLLAGL